jgi:phenylalanyl-tRNA synthetase beta chain
MKVPFQWLKEFVPVPGDTADVAERLTMRGLEVEGIEHLTPSFTNVSVGEIMDLERHPSADRLSLCQVRMGKDVLPVVCGAPNVVRGAKVPVAIPGARLGDGIVIEKKQLRGIESYGMLCSEKELGLSDDHSGIFILPETAEPGRPLALLPEIDDFVFEINVPPNRGDCQSILGIAREVASAFGVSVALPPVPPEETRDLGNLIGLSILDEDACPRYVLRMIRDIAIVPSPFWMRSRISKAGMRPINSIVDVTNYVMLELGQPLHAFDYATIGGRRIEVRVASEEIVFRTLDGMDRTLEHGDILICDGSGPVALAGVMGGENSEIGPKTRDVALESAFFNPLFIRRTARRLDLRSEASSRFEKGIDLDNVDYCARRAMDLMHRVAGGTVVEGSKETYARKGGRVVSLNFQRTAEIIGAKVTPAEIASILGSIGIAPVEPGEERAVFSIPSYRHDLIEDFDLMEEVARIVGYDNIPSAVPVSPLLPVSRDERDVAIDVASELLTASGFFEVINYGFFSAKDIERFAIPGGDVRRRSVPIMNPISKDFGVMRTFLAPGILESLAYNVNRGTKNLGVFEVGKVFFDAGQSALPLESLRLCCARTGKEREYFWRDSFKEVDFFDLKGVIETLFDRFNLELEARPSSEPFLDRTTAADLYLKNERLGWIGELRENVLQAYDIKQKVICAELDFESLVARGSADKVYRPVPRYPAVTRDFSFYVDDAIPVATLVETIKAVSPLIVSVGIFDLFRKEVRSISFRVVFQSYEDTLTDENVNGLQQIIIDRLTRMEGIKLRT